MNEKRTCQCIVSALAIALKLTSAPLLLLPRRLERMSGNIDSSNVALRMIDFFSIPRANGDCVVLLLVHPGHNILGRYFPPAKVNDLLLADMSRSRTPPEHGDAYMANVDEPELEADMEPIEVMDLASFLECVSRISYRDIGR